MSDHVTIDGYVADIPYPSIFHIDFSATWVDACLLIHGLAPPRAARAPFTLIDLGCGDGFGVILQAAAHPEGRFIGIDANAAHIEEGLSLIRRAGLTNIDLRHETFQQAQSNLVSDGACADYITAQGVLSWVSPNNREALLDLAATLLRPGGVFVVGYNTVPGWSLLAPFQRLICATAADLPGNSAQRFESALAQIRAANVHSAETLARIDAIKAKVQPGYLPHEFLNEHWSCLWADDVIARLAVRGFDFVGTSARNLLIERFALKGAQRESLAAFPGLPAREVARDIMLDNSFRREIYAMGSLREFSPKEQSRMRLESHYATGASESSAKFEYRAVAGKLSFDNAAAHAILRHLETGPSSLSKVEGIGAADLLNTADALLTAGLIWPAEPFDAAPQASKLNAILDAEPNFGYRGLSRAGHHGALVNSCNVFSKNRNSKNK